MFFLIINHSLIFFPTTSVFTDSIIVQIWLIKMTKTPSSWLWEARNLIVQQYLDSVLKSRDITLLTKVCIVKAMAFPVVIYGCESWTIKKTEHQRIDAFKLQCLWALLRVPWTGRRSNESIPKEINPFRFIGRTDAEAEFPILWSPDVKN